MTEHTPARTALPWGLQPIDVLTAASTGLLTLPDPARRTPLTRFLLRTAVAGTAGAGMWAGTGEDSELAWDVSRRAALTTGAVGLVYGAAELGETLDGALQRRLVRSGVRRPRLVMALTGAGLALALAVLERRTAPPADEEELAPDPVNRPVRQQVRELAEAILGQTEDHESLRLRAQLAAATEVYWGESEDALSVEIVVPDDVSRVVPREFTFPVRAHFTSPSGVPCTVRLYITDGRLSAVGVDVSETWDPAAAGWDPIEDPLADASMPRLDQVTLVAEGFGRS